MSKVDQVKELLGLGRNTSEEEMDERTKEIIEEVKEE